MSENKVPDGPGNLADLNSGDKKSWLGQAAGRGSSFIGSMQDLADASSPPELAVATVSSRMEALQALASPGKYFVDNNIGFLVSIVLSPLVELAEWAIGDPEQMKATAKGWEKVATWLDHAAEEETRRAEATAPVWAGPSGDAFRKQMREFGEGVTAMAQDVRELKEILELIADLFDMFIQFVIELLTELVIGLIVEWLAAMAASWITAGASVGTATATTTFQVGQTGIRITTRATKLQTELYRLFKQLEGILNKLRKNKFLEKIVEPTKNLREGGMVKRFLARQADKKGGTLFSTVTKAERPKTVDSATKVIKEATEGWTSSTGNRFMKIKDAGYSPKTGELVDLNATGESALAANVAQSLLGKVLGGTTRSGSAAWKAGVEVGTDQVIKQGAEHAYDEGKDLAQGTPSKEERRSAQERGFSW
ncbi:WXG100 family type VII secretion target [Streptoalloteichus hindustanus]|uniref:Outer membrane channel protein CpnT-like N-terminal domain-containing protein n=1 Tax=Streptoalloteichus hindustanus TaxID=2017 RepID=A0A1M5N950_STRHI|nr:hypothetical protein [Streptoalloteichus hindustanus]SHG85719.1 hypothetical protein SAMN05444320_11528 [Streptoalloteichus hindustanus]